MRRLAQFKVDEIAEGAIDRALQSRNPEALEPGIYPVILEPQAVANIVGTLRWGMGARSADEGRSFFSAPSGKTRSAPASGTRQSVSVRTRLTREPFIPRSTEVVYPDGA